MNSATAALIDTDRKFCLAEGWRAAGLCLKTLHTTHTCSHTYIIKTTTHTHTLTCVAEAHPQRQGREEGARCLHVSAETTPDTTKGKNEIEDQGERECVTQASQETSVWADG